MTDWLSAESSGLESSVPVLATRLLLAWICGYLIAVIARRRHTSTDKGMLTITLVLMCILIGMATQIIGNNVARAFSLVGALSIVRFRTAVPETRDVAFVLAAVVLGMAVGAGQYWVAGLGLIVVGLASLFEGRGGATENGSDNVWGDGPATGSSASMRLTLQVALSAVNAWTAVLNEETKRHELLSAETVRKGSGLELVFRLYMNPNSDSVAIVGRLNSLPGIESVSLKQLGS